VEQDRFDDLTRSLVARAPRRTALRGLAVGVLAGLLGASPLAEADARGRGRGKTKKGGKGKGKTKKGQSFVAPPPPPPPPPCGGTCDADFPQCCSPTTQDPGGFCAFADATCCTTAEGSGFCMATATGYRSQCCLPGSAVGCCVAATETATWQCCPENSHSACAPKQSDTFTWDCCPAGSKAQAAPVGWECCQVGESSANFCHPLNFCCASGCCARSGTSGVQAQGTADPDRLARLADAELTQVQGEGGVMNGSRPDRKSPNR
jgi:hypothetical protein